MLRTNTNAYYLNHFNVSGHDLMRHIEIMFIQRFDIIQDFWCISKLGTGIDKNQLNGLRIQSVIPKLICD